MRILLGTQHLRALGGTEMWTRMMYDTLSADHHVDVFATDGNLLWPDLPAYDPRAQYDLAIINHNQTMRALRRVRAKRVIMVLHGKVPPLEWPVLGADAYVAVAEDVAHFVPVRSTVIRNPIDLARFAPQSPVSPQLGKVAMMTNYHTPAWDLMAEACALLGVELRTAGMMSSSGTTDKPEELFAWADLVVGVGRTALEGMAAGRNVYCLSPWGAGGMVTQDNVVDFGRWNWVGRLPLRWPTAAELAEEMRTGYDPGRDLRSYVVANHEPARIAEQFLTVARKIPWSRRLLGQVIRRGPAVLMTARMMTLVDPLLRELQRRHAPDGRPGVLTELA